MFVRNRTPFKVALAHGHISEGRSIGAVVVSTAYRVAGGVLTTCDPPDPLPTDPPDTSQHELWAGVSVTAAGSVYGPRSAPFRRFVRFVVGDAARHLVVSGDRHWTTGVAGNLEPSAPAPFDRLPLSFARSFGGYVDISPGLFPGTDLPFPGGRLAYSLNGDGVGFYLDKASAEGRPLPNFELAEQVVKEWSDRPLPGCFAPCPELVALRMPAANAPGSEARWNVHTREGMLESMFRALHHAPGYMIFDDVPSGAPVQLDGVGSEEIRFAVPPAPARVRLRRHGGLDDARPGLRSLHVDGDRGLVLCVHGYPFIYEESSAPSWVLVETSVRED